MAANSLSTLMNSHGVRLPSFGLIHQALDDVRLRGCGADHLGAAQGHRLGDRLGTFNLLEHGVFGSGLLADVLEGVGGGQDVALRDLGGEFLPDGLAHGLERDEPWVAAAKAPSSAALGTGRPTRFIAISVAGTVCRCCAGKSFTNSASPRARKLRAVLMRM